LAEVTAGQDENFDSLLKRFNRKVQQDGILAELRRREHYEKPSIKRKRKKAAKKRGSARTNRMFRRAGSR
jgi:small subunit ribosomal protein S21